MVCRRFRREPPETLFRSGVLILKKLRKIGWKLYSAFWLAFVKPSILFESKPIFSDNTRAVYDEMVRRGYGRKYRLVWFDEWDEFYFLKNGEPVRFNPRKRKTLRQTILHYSCLYKTKCIICCNTFLPSAGKDRVTYGKKQICFYLTHGIPMKHVKSYYTSRGGVDYMLSPASTMNSLMADEFSVDEERVFAAGFPRNDVFARQPIDLNKAFGTGFRKIIIWYPTFRQNLDNSLVLGGDSMPLIHDEQNAIRLNEIASKYNVLLIIKPHFVQDLSRIHKLDLSNLWLISDDFFDKYGFSSYEMLAASDALLTDYSSVYFDYTLRDKPIGVIWEDIESYREFPGFAIDLDDYLKGAEKIYTIEDLCNFVRDVAEEKDRLVQERREIRDRVNCSLDGNNSERVVDFIVKKADL